MPKGRGSGHRKKEEAFERQATKHHDFIGEAAPERAREEERKREHLEAEVVQAMASQMERLASETEGDGAIGPEFPIRIPRTLEEAREVTDKLREKAEERIEDLPAPAKRAVELLESAAGLLFAPLRAGLRLAKSVLEVPAAMVRILLQREA